VNIVESIEQRLARIERINTTTKRVVGPDRPAA
jgi:hypothetical protein